MSVLDEAYELDSPNIISDAVGGETLAINLRTGAYYVFPPESLPVWTAVCGGVRPIELLTGPDDARATSLEDYVERLLRHRLLRPGAAQKTIVSPIEWAPEDLQLVEYTDMADLLGPDPIHDADAEVGWPTPRAGD